MENEKTKHAAMTPKTQSDKLRELSQRYRQIKEYNNSGDEFGNGYACGKEDAYTTVADELEDLLSDPVAEPASAGEPPRYCANCKGNEIYHNNGKCIHTDRCECKQFVPGAARPSEPYAPQPEHSEEKVSEYRAK